MPLDYDPYKDARHLGIFEEIPRHDFQEVNAGHVVERILSSRERFEERQKNKGVKGVGEEQKRRTEMESGGSLGERLVISHFD